VQYIDYTAFNPTAAQ